MEINGVMFNTDVLEIVKELKAQLHINGVERFAKFFDSGDDIMVCCPYHKEGQERRPSAGIRKSDGLFHCLACGKTVDITELIANCFGYTDPLWGFRWLTKNFLTVEVEEREAITLNMERVDFSRKGDILDADNTDKSVYVSDSELDKYRYTHKYLYERGLTDEVIDLFDIGYDVDTDSITFPVKDKSGNCLFIARRSVSHKRFDLPKNIEKPLYGLHEIEKSLLYYDFIEGGWECYVCEGLFDCLRLWCNGKFAVAGFGCLFSDYQIEQLKQLPTRKLILALDNDEAGRKATQKLKRAINNKIVAEVVIPNGRKDIGELTDDEIISLEEIF